MTKTDAAMIEIELDNGKTLKFEVRRQDYIAFVNSAGKNPFNAMNNLLASSVADESSELFTELQANPANVTTLAGELIEQYQPDVAVVVKKRSR